MFLKFIETLFYFIITLFYFIFAANEYIEY